MSSPVAVWGALVIVYLVWGSTYLAIRVVVDTAPPLLAMGARFVAVGSDLGLLYAAAAEIGTLPPGSVVLDVPCGGGVALRGLRPQPDGAQPRRRRGMRPAR